MDRYSMSQADVLLFIQEHEQVTAQEVSDETDIHERGVHAKMKSLEKAGFVEKQGIRDNMNDPIVYEVTDKGFEKDAESLRGMVV